VQKVISIDRLNKSFAEVVAVDNISLQAKDGLITGLLGPNGAGKSTTLRSIYGLQKPDRGEVLIDGIDVNLEHTKAMEKVGIFPDSVGLYDRLTTREHLRFYGEMHNLHRAALGTAISRVSTYFDLDELMDRRCKGFSHGQQMKVALSRALIHTPQNLVLDEPTNGLDVMSIRTLRSILKRLRDEGRCILFSSHVMQEVSALCDYIYIMARGQIVAEGTPGFLCEISGQESLEEAFVTLIGSDEGMAL
jgi:sodium transport system ATP-binding protein